MGGNGVQRGATASLSACRGIDAGELAGSVSPGGSLTWMRLRLATDGVAAVPGLRARQQQALAHGLARLPETVAKCSQDEPATSQDHQRQAGRASFSNLGNVRLEFAPTAYMLLLVMPRTQDARQARPL